MRVLLDTCVWGGAVAVVRAAGHDVIWAGSWSEDPGDEEILARAHAAGRVVITLDKDFGELAVGRSQAHSGVVRLVGIAAHSQGSACVRVLRDFGEELAGGALLTVETGRIRIRTREA